MNDREAIGAGTGASPELIVNALPLPGAGASTRPDERCVDLNNAAEPEAFFESGRVARFSAA